jgi:hypothetical protein
MNHAAAHSFVARCLVEAGFLSGVHRSPGIEQEDASDVSFDIEGIRRFAGFLVKVRHNPLRASFPCTFSALARAGIEIEVFARYFDRFAALRAAGPLSDGKRTKSFVDFLLDTLPEVNSPYAYLVRDVVLHEAQLWQLCEIIQAASHANESVCNADLPRSATDRPSLQHVPRIRGVVLTARFSCDPRVLIMQLSRSIGVAAFDVERYLMILGYWLVRGSDKIQYIELDVGAALLLSIVDGRRNVADIGRTCRTQGIPLADDAVFEALNDLVDRRILIWSAP